MSAFLSLAEQNDWFRKHLGMPQYGAFDIPGRYVISKGVEALGGREQDNIFFSVRNFTEFTEDNDPHGEHDFGAIDHPTAGKVFWKIDYYDPDMEAGSENPSDPEKTVRVLTIMLAQEY